MSEAASAKSQAEQARSDALFLRGAAITELGVAIMFMALIAGRVHWLPGGAWTPVPPVGAAVAIASAPYLWALAELRATKRTVRWAWAISGVLDLGFGIAAAAIAVTNGRSHWLGGSFWTVVLALLALTWLLGVPGAFARARRRR